MYLIYIFIIIYGVYGNDCNLCDCEESLNLVYCYGYAITNWPKVPDNSWVFEISFIKTRIFNLPILRDDFINLQTVVIEKSPLLDCTDIFLFRKNHENVLVLTDILCNFTSTTMPTNFTTEKSGTTASNAITFATLISPNDKNNISEYLISGIIAIATILMALLIGLIFGIINLRDHEIYRIISSN